MPKNQIIVTDLTFDAGTLDSVRTRELWQHLFAMYRSNFGSLNNMNDLLVDLHNCETAIDRSHKRYETKFIWAFSTHGTTVWIWEHDFDGDAANTAMAHASGCNVALRCSVRRDCATFRVLPVG